MSPASDLMGSSRRALDGRSSHLVTQAGWLAAPSGSELSEHSPLPQKEKNSFHNLFLVKKVLIRNPGFERLCVSATDAGESSASSLVAVLVFSFENFKKLFQPDDSELLARR